MAVKWQQQQQKRATRHALHMEQIRECICNRNV